MNTTIKQASGSQLLKALRESSSKNRPTCECGLPILREEGLSEGNTHTCECGNEFTFQGKNLGESQWEGPTKE